jgi:hypothetical protein
VGIISLCQAEKQLQQMLFKKKPQRWRVVSRWEQKRYENTKKISYVIFQDTVFL